MIRRHRHASLARAVSGLATLALLAACSSHPGPKQTVQQETAKYIARARGGYLPPGPPEDPWGPYIREASAKFDVPDGWIRALMRVESGGKEYLNGQLITSGAGAMGLMQVMPGTYDELRERYRLGDDPFDPRDNIMAGVAYMREMYDMYGSPGFLAAYNAGPGRLDDYLSNNRPLPDETRRYVAMIGPNLLGSFPRSRSPAEQYAMNAVPINIPPGTRYGRAVQLASANGGGGGRIPARQPIEVAQLPDSARRSAESPSQHYAMVLPPPVPPQPAPQPAGRGGFGFIASANAAEAIPLRRAAPATGQWAVQVGAFANHGQAQTALGQARERARAELAAAHSFVGSVHQPHGVLYRARLTGLSRDTAVQACERLSHGRMNCIVLSPDAQM
jgi:cell division septation protein DedD